jgi:hypothetical protein
MEKIKNFLDKIFGKKKEFGYEDETPRRIEPRREEVVEEDFTPRYKLAKKWREEKEMEEPLVKRSGFKRRI